MAGKLGFGTFNELVGNAIGLVVGEAKEGADGADGEVAVGAAIVRQAEDDVRHGGLFGVALLLADEVDDGLADDVVELLVGREADALDLQVVGGDVVGVGDALLLQANLQVERAEALDMDVAAVQQLLGNLLLEGFHHQFVESGVDDGVLLDVVAQIAVRHGHTDSAHVVGGRFFFGAWRLVDVVGDAVSFFDLWHSVLFISWVQRYKKSRRLRCLSQIFCTFAANLYDMEKKRVALRKLLEAVEKEILRKPDRKTLDHLSLLAGFQDWDSFQQALHGEARADENYK